MRIRYLLEADDDLEGVKHHYLMAGGKALALHRVRSIRKEVAGLSDNPNIAPPYEIAKDVRRLVVAGGTYLVFYRVREVIEVIHIRRAEREPATAEDLGKIGNYGDSNYGDSLQNKKIQDRDGK